MRRKKIILLCCAAMLAGILAGCAGSAADKDKDKTQTMQRVLVVDETYADVLSKFDLVGEFHNGFAFAANYVADAADIQNKAEFLTAPVECGYVSLDGTYTPLYTVPNEYRLFTPEDGVNSVHGLPSMFSESEEGVLINFSRFTEEQLKEAGVYTVPYTDAQARLDAIFAVGDNGWVPYYANGKWGYCDLQGNVTFEPKYDFVQPFYDGEALVCYFDGMYHWMLIDEKGTEKVAFEPCEKFATRQPGSKYIQMKNKMGLEEQLYLLDGTLVDAERGGYGKIYGDSGNGVLVFRSGKWNVYDAQGEFLYANEQIEKISPQDGHTVYTDGTYYGILGKDGAVQCEARFMEILKLEADCFYAREQGKIKIGRYDYDGNLLELAPACVRVAENASGGYTLYNGKGDVLAEYFSKQGHYSINSDVLYTEEGFVYLRLDDQTFITVHIAVEEKPVDAQEQAQSQLSSSASQPAAQDLVVTKQKSVVTQADAFCWFWDFTKTNYDEMTLSERERIRTAHGLQMYYTPEHSMIICDEQFNTVFTVPQESIEMTTDVAGDGVTPMYPIPEIRYIGDGLWAVWMDRRINQTQENGAWYVFDKNGTIRWSWTERAYRWGTGSFNIPSIVSQGYFIVQDKFISVTGEQLQLKVEGESTLKRQAKCFSDGLAASGYGYINLQGEVVLPIEKLQQGVMEYSNVQDEEVSQLETFEGDTAFIVTTNVKTKDLNFYRIDRSGNIVEKCSKEDYQAIQESKQQHAQEVYEKFERDTERGPFRIVMRNSTNTIITPSGKEVFAPDSFQLMTDIVQWSPKFAFVWVENLNDQTKMYMLLDDQGKFYPDCVWDQVIPLEENTAIGIERQSKEHYVATHITISAQ